MKFSFVSSPEPKIIFHFYGLEGVLTQSCMQYIPPSVFRLYSFIMIGTGKKDLMGFGNLRLSSGTGFAAVTATCTLFCIHFCNAVVVMCNASKDTP